EPGLHADPGPGDAHRRYLRVHQPHRRCAVCVVGSAHSLRLSGGRVMSITTLPIADDIIETRRSAWQATLHFCRREPLGAFGMLIVIIMVITGVSAELIAPYSPTA